MTDIHSCSYFCTRQECIKAQRDELRDRLEAQQQAEPVAFIETGTIYAGEYQDADVYLNEEQIDRQINDKADGKLVRVPLYTSPRITTAQVEQIKRLADEYAQMKQAHGAFCNADSRKFLDESRAALHDALDALVKP